MRETGPEDRDGRAVLFTVTVFLGAALLLFVQPLCARRLLPLLGGTPAVWNTCMLFFQLLLVGGYAYVHWLIRLGSGRRQLLVHALLLGLSLFALPNLADPGPRPPVEGSPIPWLLLSLLRSVGAPFFLLATSAPLLQSWYSHTGFPSRRDPYCLYAASNAGSLLALLAFPTLVEPNLDLRSQATIWSCAFVLFALLTVMAGGITNARPRYSLGVDSAQAAAPVPAQVLLWLFAAFVPSSLFLGVTRHVTTDVASVPLLWVLPLSVYLLTFVLAFARRPPISVRLASRMMLVLVPLGLVAMAAWWTLPAPVSLLIHLLLLFFVALVCHGRLAETRPDPRYLTGFFLTLAVGGALGGIFNALLAPLWFDSILEYPLMAVLALLLRVRSPQPANAPGLARRRSLAVDGVVLLCALGVPFGLTGVPGGGRPLLSQRTFFGVHRVRPHANPEALWYTNGTTVHGLQLVRDRAAKTAYYHEQTGLGQLFLALDGATCLDRVGVVGLGVGTIAAWAQPGQQYTFFEIDPLVAWIARDSGHFTFLADSQASQIEIVLGDGRLSLERSADDSLGLLVLDTFSSDAIPVHMLTFEAFELYFRKLTPDGVLAVHITNRHLDLRRLLHALARETGTLALEWSGKRSLEPVPELGQNPSEWVLLTSHGSPSLDRLTLAGFSALPEQPPVRVWTDDFSNLLSLFKGW